VGIPGTFGYSEMELLTSNNGAVPAPGSPAGSSNSSILEDGSQELNWQIKDMLRRYKDKNLES